MNTPKCIQRLKYLQCTKIEQTITFSMRVNIYVKTSAASSLSSVSIFTFRVQRTHVARFVHIVWADLNLMFQHGIWKTIKEQLIDGHVKGWNDFLRIVNELSVQVCIKLLQVTAVNV